ncbi:MAG TPA: RNA chaperone Hfq, partial [Xanthomonadaceae bacterium]|nr:RNA chaperone Hfq [Xanthomonadaceae bacterium]
MATETPQRLQDTFLDHLVSKKTPVTVFLINGVKLQGAITGYDNFCVLVTRDGQSQAVYKHAVSTIAPNYPVDLWGGSAEAESEAPAPR